MTILLILAVWVALATIIVALLALFVSARDRPTFRRTDRATRCELCEREAPLHIGYTAIGPVLLCALCLSDYPKEAP